MWLLTVLFFYQILRKTRQLRKIEGLKTPTTMRIRPNSATLYLFSN